MVGEFGPTGNTLRSLVRRRDKVAYKYERVGGRFYWPKAIRQMSALPYSHSSSNGQHNNSSLREQNRGTISFDLCMLAQGMWEWTEARNIHLSAVHLPGQLNLIADTLSRLIDLCSEWMLSPSIFRQVCLTYSIPKVDLFATRVNNQVPNFVSWFQIQKQWRQMYSQFFDQVI